MQKQQVMTRSRNHGDIGDWGFPVIHLRKTNCDTKICVGDYRGGGDSFGLAGL